MVTTVYCLMVKFPTSMRIRYVKVDQEMTRQCHIQSLQLSRQVVGEPEREVFGDVLAIEQSEGTELTFENLDPEKDYPKPKLIEQMVDIQVEDINGWVKKVGLLLD